MSWLWYICWFFKKWWHKNNFAFIDCKFQKDRNVNNANDRKSYSVEIINFDDNFKLTAYFLLYKYIADIIKKIYRTFFFKKKHEYRKQQKLNGGKNYILLRSTDVAFSRRSTLETSDGQLSTWITYRLVMARIPQSSRVVSRKFTRHWPPIFGMKLPLFSRFSAFYERCVKK